MVWVAIAYNTRPSILLIRGPMTVQWYVHDIPQPHVLPLIQRLPGGIFQQDNVRPHAAKVSHDCLRTVTTLPRLSRFPYVKIPLDLTLRTRMILSQRRTSSHFNE
ncbi:transposable element Tcb1 transposase [Trichonephila clavipes]|nr:transposable element Tcb1 transposase [Trichonephila clavipes]